MKKRVLLAMMSAVLLTGCTFSTEPPFIRGEGPLFESHSSDSYAYDDPDYQNEPVAEPVSTEPENTEPENTEPEKETVAVATEAADMSKYSTEWGNDQYGYVNLDDYWIDFLEEGYIEESDKMLQYGAVGPVNDSYYMVTMAAYHSNADYLMQVMVEEDKQDSTVTKIEEAQTGDLYSDGAHVAAYYSVTKASDYTNVCVIICVDRANSDECHYIAVELVDDNAGDINESIFASKYKELIKDYSEFKIIEEMYPTVDLTPIYDIVK